MWPSRLLLPSGVFSAHTDQSASINASTIQHDQIWRVELILRFIIWSQTNVCWWKCPLSLCLTVLRYSVSAEGNDELLPLLVKWYLGKVEWKPTARHINQSYELEKKLCAALSDTLTDRHTHPDCLHKDCTVLFRKRPKWPVSIQLHLLWVTLCLSKCLVLWNLISISSFWGQPPWHYGDPWCLRPSQLAPQAYGFLPCHGGSWRRWRSPRSAW